MDDAAEVMQDEKRREEKRSEEKGRTGEGREDTRREETRIDTGRERRAGERNTAASVTIAMAMTTMMLAIAMAMKTTTTAMTMFAFRFFSEVVLIVGILLFCKLTGLMQPECRHRPTRLYTKYTLLQPIYRFHKVAVYRAPVAVGQFSARLQGHSGIQPCNIISIIMSG